jgi:hypothetical protein
MDPTEWGLLAGTLVPLIVAVLARWSWSSTVKFWMAFVGCAALGIGTVYYAGGFDPAKVVTSILAVLGAAQLAYYAVFKPLGFTNWILDNVGNQDPLSVTK